MKNTLLTTKGEGGAGTLRLSLRKKNGTFTTRILISFVLVVGCATIIVDSYDCTTTTISFVRSTRSSSPAFRRRNIQQPQEERKCFKNAIDKCGWNPNMVSSSWRRSTLLFQSRNNNNSDGNNYIDAEVVATSKTMKKKKKATPKQTKKNEFELLNMVELAKKLQPDISTERVPFVAADNDNSNIDGILLYQIDVPKSKLLLQVDDDDDEVASSSSTSTVTFTIATPADHAVALCYHLTNQNDDSNDTDDNIKYQWLDPEKDSVVGTKLFKVAGETLQEWFGHNLVLRNTPQTLTVIGDLDRVCDQMREGQLPSDYLLKNDEDEQQTNEQLSDETKQQLRDMMKQLEEEETTEDENDAFVRELEEKYGLNNDSDNSNDPDLMNLEMNEDLLSLFDMNDDDNSLFRMFDKDEDDGTSNISEEEAREEVEQLKQLIDEVKSTKGIDLLERMELGGDDSTTSPIVGERLFTFDDEDRTYSLVRLLQPPILIGKEDPMRGAGGRYTILSDAERSQILPILEAMIQQDYQNLLNQTTKQSSQQAP